MESLSVLVARRVREVRESLGMSQEALAEAAGLSRDAVSRIERHDRAARVDTLAALAIALGVAPGELIGQLKVVPPQTQRQQLARAAAGALGEMPTALATAAVQSLRLFAKASKGHEKKPASIKTRRR